MAEDNRAMAPTKMMGRFTLMTEKVGKFKRISTVESRRIPVDDNERDCKENSDNNDVKKEVKSAILSPKVDSEHEVLLRIENKSNEAFVKEI